MNLISLSRRRRLHGSIRIVMMLGSIITISMMLVGIGGVAVIGTACAHSSFGAISRQDRIQFHRTCPLVVEVL
jgi:hypothetical protein